MSRRFPALVALALLVALAAGACGAVGSTAVTVNGSRISSSAVDDELEEIRDNRPYREAIEANRVDPATGQPDLITGEGRGTFDSAFAAQVLNRRIYFELIHQERVRRKLKIGPIERADARKQVVDQLGQAQGQQDRARGEKFLKGFSASYQKELVQRQAEVAVLLKDLAESDVTDAEVRSFFDERKSQLVEVCVSHILLPTKEAADGVRAELSGGADFAQVAEGKSTDPSAKQNKGNLGCASPDRYVPEFSQAAVSLPVGELSQPVQTQFGFHILRVDERRDPSLRGLASQIRQELADTKLGTRLQKLVKDADIDINPRFGKFDKSLPQPRVVPPEAPSTPTTRAATPAP